jgi:hypothetical protein
MSGSYLNLKASDKGRYIYRVMPLKRVHELFQTGKNVLVRPSLWEDPFENFILNASAVMPDGTVGNFGFRRDLYGQCWTQVAASDAMWRIYSPDTKAVRLRTTVERLLKSLANACGHSAGISAFISRVQYLREADLIKFGKDIFRNGLDAQAIARTLLIKRNAFRHEHEVRLIYLESEPTIKDIFAYRVDPHVLVDQMMIDPRYPRTDAAKVISTIRKQTGFAGPIKRSLLYAAPEKMMFPIGIGRSN